MAIFIPRKKEFWQRKPTTPRELNEGHFLADGLWLYTLNFGEEQDRCLLGNTLSPDSTTYGYGRGGAYSKGDGANSTGIVTPQPPVSDWSGVTCLVIRDIVFTRTPSLSWLYPAHISSVSVNQYYGNYNLFTAESGTLYFSAGNFSSLISLAVPIGTQNNSNLFHAGAYSVQDHMLRMYATFGEDDMTVVTPVNQPTSFLGAGASECHLNYTQFSNDGQPNPDPVYVHAIWGKEVGEDEIRELERAPYQILKPKKTYFSFSEAQAASTFWVQRKKEFSTEKPDTDTADSKNNSSPFAAALTHLLIPREYTNLSTNYIPAAVGEYKINSDLRNCYVGTDHRGTYIFSKKYYGGDGAIHLPALSPTFSIVLHMVVSLKEGYWRVLSSENEQVRVSLSSGDTFTIKYAGYTSSFQSAALNTLNTPIVLAASFSPTGIEVAINGATVFSTAFSQTPITDTVLRLGRNSPDSIRTVYLCAVSSKVSGLGEVRSLSEAPYQILKPRKTYLSLSTAVPASATLSGSATASITKWDIKAGGKQIILDLTNDTWVAAGAAFDAIRQDILDGLVAAQNEINGWNNVVSPNEPVTSVVRTSNTRVTITLEAH